MLSAIAILIKQHSEPGDGVTVQRPVFFEFQSVIRIITRYVPLETIKQTVLIC